MAIPNRTLPTGGPWPVRQHANQASRRIEYLEPDGRGPWQLVGELETPARRIGRGGEVEAGRLDRHRSQGDITPRGPDPGGLEEQAVAPRDFAPTVEDAAIAGCRASVVGRRAVADDHQASVLVFAPRGHHSGGSVREPVHPDQP